MGNQTIELQNIQAAGVPIVGGHLVHIGSLYEALEFADRETDWVSYTSTNAKGDHSETNSLGCARLRPVRRPGNAVTRGDRGPPQADGSRRQSSHPLAHHANILSSWFSQVCTLSWLQVGIH